MQPFRDQVECLVPSDALEDIRLAAVSHFPFWRSSATAHRVEQARGRVDTVQILGDLAAKKAAGNRMGWVALDPGGAARLVNGYQNGARVRTVMRTDSMC